MEWLFTTAAAIVVFTALAILIGVLSDNDREGWATIAFAGLLGYLGYSLGWDFAYLADHIGYIVLGIVVYAAAGSTWSFF